MFKKLSLALVCLCSIQAFASQDEIKMFRSLSGNEATVTDEAFKYLKEGRVKSARISEFNYGERVPLRHRFEITLVTGEVLDCGWILEDFISLFSRFLPDDVREQLTIYGESESKFRAYYERRYEANLIRILREPSDREIRERTLQQQEELQNSLRSCYAVSGATAVLVIAFIALHSIF